MEEKGGNGGRRRTSAGGIGPGQQKHNGSGVEYGKGRREEGINTTGYQRTDASKVPKSKRTTRRAHPGSQPRQNGDDR